MVTVTPGKKPADKDTDSTKAQNASAEAKKTGK